MAIDLGSISSNRPSVDSSTVRPSVEGVLSGKVRQEVQAILGQVSASEMLAYMAQQALRLSDLQQRPPIKAGSAELPPPDESLFAEDDPTMQVTAAEMESLEAFQQQLIGLASAEDGEAGDEFLRQGQGILDALREKYGPAPGSGGDSGGMMDWYMLGEISKEAQEVDDRWRELMTRLINSKEATVETLLIAIAEYYTDKYGRAMKMAFQTFAGKQEQHEQFVASLELDKGATPGAADMFRATQEQQSYMMDSQMGMQMIQAIRQDLDRVQNMTKSHLGEVHTTLRSMISNIPRGG